MILDVDEEWHRRAVLYLRGGYGGEHGPFLYRLVFGMRPRTVLDIGTARGFSALYMAKAMVDAGIDGYVYTIDTKPHDEPLRWHSPKQFLDPFKDREVSRREILSSFEEEIVGRVVFLTGRSSEVLRDWRYGKVDLAFEQMVYGEASITLPLFTGAVYHRGAWKQRTARALGTFFAGADFNKQQNAPTTI